MLNISGPFGDQQVIWNPKNPSYGPASPDSCFCVTSTFCKVNTCLGNLGNLGLSRNFTAAREMI